MSEDAGFDDDTPSRDDPRAASDGPTGNTGVRVARDGRVCIVTIDRPHARNAVDGPTARALERAFRDFDADGTLDVAILAGAGGTFSAGADLKAIGSGDAARMNPLDADLDRTAPMGATRLGLSKPVIAAIEGHAVAGGLELALWCDLRIAGEGAIFGIFCRRWGVPLIDGGTVRLPRLIGESRALDLILTGRAVDAHEAFDIGLVNRLVPPGHALVAALALAHELSALPQTCLRSDRASVKAQAGRRWRKAMAEEFRLGNETLASGESAAGARAFAAGSGRHGGKRS